MTLIHCAIHAHSQHPGLLAMAVDEAVYKQQIALGKSHEYAFAYATKIAEGEIFARHFAAIRFVDLVAIHHQQAKECSISSQRDPRTRKGQTAWTVSASSLDCLLSLLIRWQCMSHRLSVAVSQAPRPLGIGIGIELSSTKHIV